MTDIDIAENKTVTQILSTPHYLFCEAINKVFPRHACLTKDINIDDKAYIKRPYVFVVNRMEISKVKFGKIVTFE